MFSLDFEFIERGTMDSRKPITSDHFLSLLFYNRKVISVFGFCLVASLVVCFCIVSVNTPTAISSSLFYWFHSFSGNIFNSELELSDGLLVAEKTHDGNRANSSFTPRDSDLGNTHDRNRANSSFTSRESDLGNTHDGNGANSSFTPRESNLVNTHEGNSATHNGNSSGNATIVGKDSGDLLNLGISKEAHDWNSSKSSEDERALGYRTRERSDSSNVATAKSPTHKIQDKKGVDFSKDEGAEKKGNGRDGVNQETKNASYGSDGRGFSERTNEGARNDSASKETREDVAKTCDIFNGRWVRDERKLYYEPGSCPHIDDDFNCHKNGRPDDGYLRWRWQPYDCNIPRLNATDFLERLNNKRLVFVGDSLNRNMWESLVCILRDNVNNKSRVYEVSGRIEFKTSGYYAFRFEDHNCSIDFVRSSFLVKETFHKNVNGSEDEKLRLDLIGETTSAYKEADILVFNTGHWWTHEKTSQGVDYYQEGNYVYPVLKVLKAYTKALNTWAKWVDQNINSNKTQVFFRGYSPSHFRRGQWNSGGQCHKESEPIFNESFIAKYPSKMRALERVIDQMRTPVTYLNISRITSYRKDGHPSIYKATYKSVEEQIVAQKTQDCSHWCLPGIPDTWNELLYASLLMNGQGSWRI